MTFHGTVYWVNTGHEFLGKYDSRTGLVTWASIYNFPEVPGTGHDLQWTVSQLGQLVQTSDGRLGTPMGSHQDAAMAVFDTSLDVSTATYWNANIPDYHGSAWPQDVYTIYDPVTGRSMESGIRNYDYDTSGDADTWTAFDADGTPHYLARFSGSWDFVARSAFDSAYSGGSSTLVGRTLYRANNNGWIDRYNLSTGSWELTLWYGNNPGPNSGRRVMPVGSLSDGTVVYQTERTYPTPAPIELWTFNDHDSLYIPINSPNSALFLVPQLADLTPARRWDLTETGYEFPGGSMGDTQGIQIVDDVAYYFRKNASLSYPNETIEFIAHDLATNTKEIVFTVSGVFLNQDGTIGDPLGSYWQNIYYPGFGLVVTVIPTGEITGEEDLNGANFF